MKIISWNVNGLRSVIKKGFWNWLDKSQADIVCLQEIKTHEEKGIFDLFSPSGYQFFMNPAQKKGYSGVAVFSKQTPLSIKTKLGLSRFDAEGRLLELEYPGFTFLGLYLPHGGRDKSKLDYKLECYQMLLQKMEKIKSKKVIAVGDFNIAHQEIDLARPQQNRNNIMFTPQERELIDKIIGFGYIDSFRKFHPEGGHYTWLSYLKRARERGLGWRIDYGFVSGPLKSGLKDAFILSDVPGSDHCPIGVDIS